MPNSMQNSSVPSSDAQKPVSVSHDYVGQEERIIKISLIQLSFEVKGYSMQDAILLMKRAWWFYLLMLLALIALVIAAISLKESLALIISAIGSVKLWLSKKSP